MRCQPAGMMFSLVIPFFKFIMMRIVLRKDSKRLLFFMRDNENWQSDILRIYVSHFGFDSGCDRVFEAISLLSL